MFEKLSFIFRDQIIFGLTLMIVWIVFSIDDSSVGSGYCWFLSSSYNNISMSST